MARSFKMKERGEPRTCHCHYCTGASAKDPVKALRRQAQHEIQEGIEMYEAEQGDMYDFDFSDLDDVAEDYTPCDCSVCKQVVRAA